MGILEGAAIGAVIGVVVVVVTYSAKTQKYAKLVKTISEPLEYSGLYHYASFKRYKNSMKFFDSYGILYLTGKTVCYKSSASAAPIAFDMAVCSVQQEPDWRWLKWFSITTPAGEKYYFDSHKMGFLRNDSSETLKGFAAIKAKMVA